MSGHSKWATIKHKKGAADKARGKLWAKLVRNIEVAAREGGGDPSSNATLRTMTTKAKSEQVPSDKIETAIKRGTGELKAELSLEEITYEGYAPAGVALMVHVATDNRNRAASDVRSTFSKNGGNIAEPGAVGWQFTRRGQVIIPKTHKSHKAKAVSEDDLLEITLDAGAEDIADLGDNFDLRCGATSIGAVCSALVDAGIFYESAERPLLAENIITVNDVADARKILRLIEALEDLDDVEDVYANFDIPESMMAELANG